MGEGRGQLSEAEAHLELLLMDSRIAGVIKENFLDRFRRLDLTHSDILDRVADLLSETRICGGRIIHIGKILTDLILRFIESKPDISSGFQLEVATEILAELAPCVGPLLSPLASEMEYQGFGGVFRGTVFIHELDRDARSFFKATAATLNLCDALLFGQEKVEAAALPIHDPDLFELDSSEDPFALDELEYISPHVRGTVKFLAKIALAGGRLENEERTFVRRILDGIGEPVSQAQLERLISQAPQESLEDALGFANHQSDMLKDKLLLAAMLLTAADGKVLPIEKKMLIQAAHFLGISRDRYSQLGGDALQMMKAHRGLLSQADAIRLPGTASDVSGPQISLSNGASGDLSEAIPPGGTENETPIDAPRIPESPRPAIPASVGEACDPEKADEVEAPTVDGPGGATDEQTEARQLWFCPACRMPQFFRFSECPQCGIIVSKWIQKSHETQPDFPPVDHLEIPDEPIHQTVTGGTPEGDVNEDSGAPVLCPNCRETVPIGATYCAFCGVRVS